MSVLADSSIYRRCAIPSHTKPVVATPASERHLWEGLDKIPRFAQRLNEDQRTEYIKANPPMISPYSPDQVRVDENDNRIVSWGTSSYGYDVRLGREFKIFTNVRNGLIDPLNPDPNCFVEHVGDYCIIPPNSYILGHTVESFDIPRDIMVICLGKSTYARLAAAVNVTPIEPGFKGQVVIEIANCSTLPLKVYANQGIAQFVFLKGDVPCKISYADRGGKYQNQTGVVTARL